MQNRLSLGIAQSNSIGKGIPISLILLVGISGFSSIYFAIAPLQSLWMLAQISSGIAVYYYVQRVERKDVIFLLASRTSFALTSFYVIYSALFLSHISSDPLGMFNVDNRFHGLSFESNILASQALFWIFIELKFRRPVNLIGSGPIFCLVIVIFLSQTRAAIVCLVILVFAGIWKKSLTAPFGLVQLILVCSFVLFLGTFNFNQIAQKYPEGSLQGRVLRLVDLNSGTAMYRKEVTKIALDDIKNSNMAIQLFGSGTNSFKQHHELDISKVESGYIGSLWIQTLYDAGLAGLFLVVLFFFNQFRLNTKNSFLSKIFYISVLLCAGVTNMIWFAYLWVSLSLFVELKSTEHSNERT